MRHVTCRRFFSLRAPQRARRRSPLPLRQAFDEARARLRVRDVFWLLLVPSAAGIFTAHAVQGGIPIDECAKEGGKTR